MVVYLSDILLIYSLWHLLARKKFNDWIYIIYNPSQYKTHFLSQLYNFQSTFLWDIVLLINKSRFELMMIIACTMRIKLFKCWKSKDLPWFIFLCYDSSVLWCDFKKQLTTYRFSEQTGVTIQTRVAMCQLQKRGQTAKQKSGCFLEARNVWRNPEI